jgi:hypothetical protein
VADRGQATLFKSAADLFRTPQLTELLICVFRAIVTGDFAEA